MVLREVLRTIKTNGIVMQKNYTLNAKRRKENQLNVATCI